METSDSISIPALVLAVLSFIISLAWNDAFKNFFQKSSPWTRKYGPWGYAIFVTLTGIAIVYLLNVFVFSKTDIEVEKENTIL